VVVVGKFRTREYEYQGEKRRAVEIVADKVQFSGKKKEDGGREDGPPDHEVPF